MIADQAQDADPVHARNGATRRSNQPNIRRTRSRTLVWAWVLALLMYLVAVPTDLVPTFAALLITDVAWTVAAFLAAASAARAARVQTGRSRIAWALFAIASTAWGLGQLAWSFYELVLGVIVPFPSIADIGYLLFGPLMIAGLLALRSTQTDRTLTWLRIANFGLIVFSLAVILIALLTNPFERSTYTTTAAVIIATESVTITVAFIVAMYLLWSYPWGSRLASLTLVTAALAVHAIAWLFYTRQLVVGEYGVGSWFNIAWLVAFALQQWAAETQVSASTGINDPTLSVVRGHQGWVEALVPAVLLLCIAITAVALAREITPRIVYFGSIILAAFAIVLALREAMLYLRGQLVQTKLEHAMRELMRATEQSKDLDLRRGELEREVEAMARAGGVGLWNFDLKTGLVKFSKEWKRQLGYEEDELGDTIEEWRARLHPEDLERIPAAVAAYLKDPKGEFVAEQRLRHRDGSYRWILTQGTLARDASGNASRMFGSHVDITERKAVEISLRDSEARYRELASELEVRVAARTHELTEAYRESQNFAYAVAHDLKAPLRAIDGFSHLLDHSAAARLSGEERGYIKRVRHGAMHMSSLIDGLLAYSRLEHRELRLCTVECRNLVHEVLRSMDTVAHASKATVDVSLAPTVVHADVEGLRMVIRNLLDNALKFASNTRPPRVEIGSYEDDGCVVITVKDNGIGFDPQYHDKIFEIFNRLHSTGYEGTGIGLALVRKAVHRMRGSVWAQAAVNQGATFFVKLPQANSHRTGEHSFEGG